MAYTFTDTTSPKFDGLTFVVPYEVMSRVTKNTLGYQVAFLKGDAEDQIFTQSMKDSLQVGETIDLKVILDPLPEWWITYFRQNAIVVPPKWDKDKAELTLSTANGDNYTLNLRQGLEKDSILDLVEEYYSTKVPQLAKEWSDADKIILKQSKEYTDLAKNDLTAWVEGEVSGAKKHADDLAVALREELQGVYTVKGSSTNANLPKNPNKGDVYNILDDGQFPAGSNVVWNGTNWDKLSETVNLKPLTDGISDLSTKIRDNSLEISRISEDLSKTSEKVRENGGRLDSLVLDLGESEKAFQNLQTIVKQDIRDLDELEGRVEDM